MSSVPTLDDVAAAVGVSSRTVSRVLRNEGGYSSATEQRVRDAVAKLGYYPNLLARGLSGRRSGTIGIVGPNMSDPFFPELADELQRRAREHGRTAFCASSFRDAEHQRGILGSLRSYGVDGVVLHPVPGSQDAVAHFARSGTPVVAIDRNWSGPGLSSVTADLQQGASLAVESLLRRGRRRIAMIAGVTSTGLPPSQPGRRQRGFESALPDNHPLLVHFSTLDMDGGREAARRLLERAPDLDGIVAYNDLIALGALTGLADAGRSVPDDVAVIGYDDIFAARISRPALTTVRYDRENVAAQAIDALESLIAEPTVSGRVTVVPVELVDRESTPKAAM